jgi:hypothetical protein
VAIHFDTKAFLRTLTAVHAAQLQGHQQGQADREAYEQQQLQNTWHQQQFDQTRKQQEALAAYRAQQLNDAAAARQQKEAEAGERQKDAAAQKIRNRAYQYASGLGHHIRVGDLKYLQQNNLLGPIQNEIDSAMAVAAGRVSPEEWKPQFPISETDGSIDLSAPATSSLPQSGAGLPPPAPGPSLALPSAWSGVGAAAAAPSGESPRTPAPAPVVTAPAPMTAPAPKKREFGLTPAQEAAARRAAAAEAGVTAKAPLTAAQADLAAARAAKVQAEAGEFPKDSNSKRLLRDRQGRKAAADAAAAPIKAGAAAASAGASQTRAKATFGEAMEHKRHNLAAEAATERRLVMQELNATAGRKKTAAEAEAVRQKLNRGSAAILDPLDRERWAYYSKRAIRKKRGELGEETFVDDPEAVAALGALEKKYAHAPVAPRPTTGGPGKARLALVPSKTPLPRGATAAEVAAVRSLIEAGTFDKEMGHPAMADPKLRMKAKAIFSFVTRKPWAPRKGR